MLRLESVDPDRVPRAAAGPTPPAFTLAWRALQRDRYRGSTAATYRVTRHDDQTVAYVIAVDLDGRLEALPDRGYGVLLPADGPPLDLDGLLRALRFLAGGTFRATLAPVDAARLSVSPSHALDRFRSHDTHLLEASSAEAAAEQLGKEARNLLRKAERDGLKLVAGRDGATMMRFLGLQVTRSARLGGPPLSRADLDRLREAFGEDAWAVVGTSNGAPVAGALVVRVGGWAILAETAALPQAFWGPEHTAVLWEAARQALAVGARCVDLGPLATDDAAGRRAKELLGGRRVAVHGITAG